MPKTLTKQRFLTQIFTAVQSSKPANTYSRQASNPHIKVTTYPHLFPNLPQGYPRLITPLSTHNSQFYARITRS